MFDSQLLFQGPGCDVNFDDPTTHVLLSIEGKKQESKHTQQISLTVI